MSVARDDGFDDATAVLDCGHMTSDVDGMTDEERWRHAVFVNAHPVGVYGFCTRALAPITDAEEMTRSA